MLVGPIVAVLVLRRQVVDVVRVRQRRRDGRHERQGAGIGHDIAVRRLEHCGACGNWVGWVRRGELVCAPSALPHGGKRCRAARGLHEGPAVISKPGPICACAAATTGGGACRMDSS